MNSTWLTVGGNQSSKPRSHGDDQAITLRALANRHTKAKTTPKTSHGLGATVVTVMSGKGGVGKTSLVANLGISLAQRGVRVLSIDGNWGLSNLDVLLGIRPAYTIWDVYQNKLPVQDILIEKPIGINNLTVLPAGCGYLALRQMSGQKQNELLCDLQKVQHLFDLVLIDTSTGIDESSLAFAAASNMVMVLVTPEPTSIANAYGLVKMLSLHTGIKSLHLVTNMVENKEQGESIFAEFSELIDFYLGMGLHFSGCINLDPNVMHATKSTIPFLLHTPYTPASQAIGKLSENLLYLKNQPDFCLNNTFTLFYKLQQLC